MYRTASDTLVSYDVSCAYWINIINRFRLSFPDLVPAIEKIRWLIPLVHVRNHKDNCMYNFASSYIINAGHFHGETAEHYWPECNQLGGQIRQMNNGHRQETLIDHHSDWNWKKTMNMCKLFCVLFMFTNLTNLLSIPACTRALDCEDALLAKARSFQGIV